MFKVLDKLNKLTAHPVLALDKKDQVWDEEDRFD